jgi:hypothetical protein
MVTFHLGDYLNGLPAEWFSGGRSPFTASWSTVAETTPHPIQLAQLADGSGLVGVATIEPVAWPGDDTLHSRVVNAVISLTIDRSVVDALYVSAQSQGEGMTFENMISVMVSGVTLSKL